MGHVNSLTGTLEVSIGLYLLIGVALKWVFCFSTWTSYCSCSFILVLKSSNSAHFFWLISWILMLNSFLYRLLCSLARFGALSIGVTLLILIGETLNVDLALLKSGIYLALKRLVCGGAYCYWAAISNLTFFSAPLFSVLRLKGWDFVKVLRLHAGPTDWMPGVLKSGIGLALNGLTPFSSIIVFFVLTCNSFLYLVWRLGSLNSGPCFSGFLGSKNL